MSVLEKLHALKSDQEQKSKDTNKGGIPRSSSKQLAEVRRSKSKENPLRESARRSKGKASTTPSTNASGQKSTATAGSWGALPGQKAAATGASPSSNTATLRLMQDLSSHEERFTPGVKLHVDPNDLLHPTMTVTPKEGYWFGASFKFRMDFPKSYPIEPPTVTCLTKIYHPNIDFSGRVCLNVLRADYSPVITLTQVLIGMLHLFYEPNPDDPLNIPVASLMETNRAQFEKKRQIFFARSNR